MEKIKFRKNDMVMVINGKDKGKTGKILKVFPDRKKAIVEKVNFTKEFIRRDQSKNIQGGVMEKEAPIHVSNLMLFCSDCGRGVRVKKKRLKDGSTIRVCSKCESMIE
jgi:large subunit ribosomal protein L24